MSVRTMGYYGDGGRKVPTFAQALNLQGMMQEPTAAYLEAREPTITQAVKSVYLRELWDGLLGVIAAGSEQTCIPKGIKATIPVDSVPMIRNSAGVTAAFAYCEIVKQLTIMDAELTDSFEVNNAMDTAWAVFRERAEEAKALQEGFGCDNSRSWLMLRDIGAEPKSQLLKDKMVAIARKAGRLYDSFGYQHKTEFNDNPEEVVGARPGTELDRALDSELALLADPDTEDMAAEKLLTGKAYVTDMRGKESKTRGPLVLVIDSSSSMHDGEGYIWSGHMMWNGRNTWAKACAVALVRIAWDENRPVRAVHFGRGIQMQEIPKDDHRALFEMGRAFLGGGTSFGPALKAGRLVVGDLAHDGYRGADIVLITDGEETQYEFHNREIDHMDRDGIKLWTVAIGQDIPAVAPVRSRAELYTFAHDRQLNRPGADVKLAAGLDKAAMGNGSLPN